MEKRRRRQDLFAEVSDFSVLVKQPYRVLLEIRFPVALEKLWAGRQLGEGSVEGVSQIEITVTI
jgi:hypothetical protein